MHQDGGQQIILISMNVIAHAMKRMRLLAIHTSGFGIAIQSDCSGFIITQLAADVTCIKYQVLAPKLAASDAAASTDRP